MKGKVVPALRERGLRRVCGAEPQRCEPQFKPAQRKADTMKTYLLKNTPAVESKAAAATDSTDSNRMKPSPGDARRFDSLDDSCTSRLPLLTYG